VEIHMNEQTIGEDPDNGIEEAQEAALSSMLRRARQKRLLRQGELAERVQLKASAVSNFEKGRRLPSVEQLMLLSRALDLDPEMLVLARSWQEVYGDGPGCWSDVGAQRRRAVLDSLANSIDNIRRAAEPQKRTQRTLLDFPEAFVDEGIVIVTGDTRESPPKNAGDIGAYSASPVDDRWIHRLGLPSNTEKVSDKEFIVSSEERLRREYGNRNLLVVGSPASNHLARILNPGGLFRYNLHGDFKRELEGILDELQTEQRREVLAHKKRDNLPRLKTLMRRFYAYGIVDPLRGDVRGFALGLEVDYGMISFAVNPYYTGGDFRCVAVLVSGFHHPGTIWALRWLGGRRDRNKGFKQHPYGGVLQMQINTGLLWEDRMRYVKTEWETDPYDQEQLLSGLEKLKSCGSALMEVDTARVNHCIQMVKSL